MKRRKELKVTPGFLVIEMVMPLMRHYWRSITERAGLILESDGFVMFLSKQELEVYARN